MIIEVTQEHIELASWNDNWSIFGLRIRDVDAVSYAIADALNQLPRQINTKDCCIHAGGRPYRISRSDAFYCENPDRPGQIELLFGTKDHGQLSMPIFAPKEAP